MRMFARLVLLASIALPVIPAYCQTATPPCPALAQDRTITFCDPIDGATVTAISVLNDGWIKDSLPHTTSMYIDGQLMTGGSGQSTNPIEWFSGESGRNYDDKIHTITFVVTDSKGTFRKSATFRQSLELPCPVPDTDRTIKICTPAAGEVTTSPVHISAVARSSIGLRFVELFVDGKDGGSDSSGTSNLMLRNFYRYLPVGTHRITLQAKDVNGGTFKSTVIIQVVAGP